MTGHIYGGLIEMWYRNASGDSDPGSVEVRHCTERGKSEGNPAPYEAASALHLVQAKHRQVASVLVYALGDLLHHLGNESGKVLGAAAGDQSIVHHHFLIHPFGTCIDEVGT